MAYIDLIVRLCESRCYTETLDIVFLVPFVVGLQYRLTPSAFTVNSICALNGENVLLLSTAPVWPFKWLALGKLSA
jgi:hypothetical protein